MHEFAEMNTRSATPARGFESNWFYYYDKPLDAAEAEVDRRWVQRGKA